MAHINRRPFTNKVLQKIFPGDICVAVSSNQSGTTAQLSIYKGYIVRYTKHHGKRRHVVVTHCDTGKNETLFKNRIFSIK